MREALKVYKSRAEIARILTGIRHRSAIYQWDEDGLVPLGAAVILASHSPDPTLKVRAPLYEKQRQEKMGRGDYMRSRKKMIEAIRSKVPKAR